MKPHIFYRSDEPDAESESFTTHCVQCAFPEAYKDVFQCFRFRINCIHFDQFMRRSVVDVSEVVVVVPLAEGNRVVRVDSCELRVVEEVPSSPFRPPVSLFCLVVREMVGFDGVSEDARYESHCGECCSSSHVENIIFCVAHDVYSPSYRFVNGVKNFL